MVRRTRLQVECLEDRTIPSTLTFDAAPAFRGLDVAAARFIPVDPVRPLAVAPAFALNYGPGPEALPALHGLQNAAARRIPVDPIRMSPVFVGLADTPSLDQ
jgi:hypothetical protein